MTVPLFGGYGEAREGWEGHEMSQRSSLGWGPEVPPPCQVHSCSLSCGWGPMLHDSSVLTSPSPSLLPH